MTEIAAGDWHPPVLPKLARLLPILSLLSNEVEWDVGLLGWFWLSLSVKGGSGLLNASGVSAKQHLQRWGMGNGGGLMSRMISSWLLIAVVVGSTVNRGRAKEGGRIGSGDADDVERLLILMHGDYTLALEQVIGLDGTDSVDEAGGMFSWFGKGCVVGNSVSSLMDSGVKVNAIDLLFIVIDKGDELWSWWVDWGKEYGGLSSTRRVLIWLRDE
jgi:hypothetical protein